MWEREFGNVEVDPDMGLCLCVCLKPFAGKRFKGGCVTMSHRGEGSIPPVASSRQRTKCR